MLIGGLDFNNTYPLTIDSHHIEIRYARDSCELMIDGREFGEMYNRYGEMIESGKISLRESLKKNYPGVREPGQSMKATN